MENIGQNSTDEISVEQFKGFLEKKKFLKTIYKIFKKSNETPKV